MKETYSSKVLFIFLILGLTLSESRPAPVREVRSSSDHSDPRWRIMAGIYAAKKYTGREQFLVSGSSPHTAIVNVGECLQNILDGMCDLLTVYELVAKVNLNSNLTALLGQNIQDSCKWLHYLVNESANGTSSSVFSQLPSSCAPENVTALHHYCYRMKVGGSDQLSQLFEDNLSFLGGCYSGTVNIRLNKESSSEWLQTTSIPADQHKHILQSH